MRAYADTSLLVSIYVEDHYSVEADNLMTAGPEIYFTCLHLAEFSHAVAQQVFRRQMSAAVAEQVYQALERDLESGMWREVSMPEGAFLLCAELARCHGPKLGVRTLDSLHVACALELKAERFWTFDKRQAKLAKAMGMKT